MRPKLLLYICVLPALPRENAVENGSKKEIKYELFELMAIKTTDLPYRKRILSTKLNGYCNVFRAVLLLTSVMIQAY